MSNNFVHVNKRGINNRYSGVVPSLLHPQHFVNFGKRSESLFLQEYFKEGISIPNPFKRGNTTSVQHYLSSPSHASPSPLADIRRITFPCRRHHLGKYCMPAKLWRRWWRRWFRVPVCCSLLVVRRHCCQIHT